MARDLRRTVQRGLTDADDGAFPSQLLGWTVETLDVDPARFFVTGSSNDDNDPLMPWEGGGVGFASPGQRPSAPDPAAMASRTASSPQMTSFFSLGLFTPGCP